MSTMKVTCPLTKNLENGEKGKITLHPTVNNVISLLVTFSPSIFTDSIMVYFTAKLLYKSTNTSLKTFKIQ